MRKIIIIFIALMFVATIIIGVMVYLGSFNKVTVKMAGDVDKALVYLVDPDEGHNHEAVGNEIETITDNSQLSLQNGSYFIEPVGDKISPEHIGFTVDGSDMTVEIDPGYSEKYLAQLLKKESAEIANVVKTDIKGAEGYSLKNPELYEKGQWYGALLAKPNQNAAQNNRDPYQYFRVILNKVNDKWTLIDSPQIVFTTHDYKDVPLDVLRSVNDLRL